MLVAGPRSLQAGTWLAELSDDALRVDLDHETLTAPRAASMFADPRTRHIVFSAVSARRGARVLDSYAARVRVVRLTPLAKRPTEIVRLLDGILRDELHEAAGASVLGPSLLRAVERFQRPRNLDELREYSPRLLAHQNRGWLVRLLADACQRPDVNVQLARDDPHPLLIDLGSEPIVKRDGHGALPIALDLPVRAAARLAYLKAHFAKSREQL